MGVTLNKFQPSSKTRLMKPLVWKKKKVAALTAALLTVQLYSRHLISDAHEWINEVPTVPIYYLAKPQPRERAWE